MTSIEQLDELIEAEADSSKQAALRRQRERALQALADAPTGDHAEDLLWYRRYRRPEAGSTRPSQWSAPGRPARTFIAKARPARG